VRFRFGNYVLDVDRRELSRGGDLIPMGPQVFDLLAYLVIGRERVVTKDDLLGAVWGGRIVSESTLTSHINAVRKAIGDNGEEQSLIRTVARKGFRFIGEVEEVQHTPGKRTEIRISGEAGEQLPRDNPVATPERKVAAQPVSLTLPDKPSIAVLPFQNMSGDSEQEYFADGVVEDIITALSRMRWLFVIARNSSFTYKGRAVEIKQVGRDLGVRYVLEGSVRKAANRVRITGQLIDASSGAHIWADRFDGTLEDIFDLQDRMATSVVGAIVPSLEQAEIERARCKPTESLGAYDYFLRGMANVHRWTRGATDEALHLFYRAIELDPNFASAYGMAAWCCIWRKLNGWTVDREQEMAEGARLAMRAVELGKDDAVALSRGGHALAWFVRDLDAAAGFLDRALVLNPNLAAAWNLSGWVRAYRGELELAIEHHARAVRLSPLDPTVYNMHVGTAFAHFLADRYDDASAWAQRALHEQPNYPAANRVLAASKALAGHLAEAQRAMAILRQLDPALRISNLSEVIPVRRPEHLAKFAEGLRQAGLPK
jgi:TolB-like protein/DNA-binding winged helix-turn-helix (wHTH) protein/tetratricopeptide (TPR) repeat protein